MTTPTSQPPVFSERYELVRHIARGGMAQVYLARDLLLDRQVALKVLFPELSVDPAFVRRFRREAQAAASLSHRNIVSIYDWGQGESTYCIVMEYVDGQTLSAMARQAPLDTRRAAQIGSDVAAALHFAHGNGVIHRDVKPGNVLLDHQGQVKVADFGIARAVGAKEGLTQTGAVMGTATYFSPEQAQGFAVDARSDVYSLGVVLYEIVAGRAPFTGDNPVSIAYKHVREQPVPLAELVPGIDPAYAAVVAKAMAKDADERYQTAGELQEDLDRFVAGQPVLAAAAPATVVAAPVVDNTVVAARVPPTVVHPAERVPVEPAVDERKRGPWYVLLAVLLAVLAVVVFFLGRSLGWWDSAATQTIPTTIVGEPVAQAVSQLKMDGFTQVPSQQTEQSSTVQPGSVIDSSPKPGSSAKTNATITLFVSTGPKQVTVPTVTGLDQNTASQKLTAAGFKVLPKEQASNSVAQGTVISQDPGAGGTAGQGSNVTIYVSTGPMQVPIPSVAGESVAAASAKLGALGLEVANPVYEPSSQQQDGAVIGTNPSSGTTVNAGSTVTIYVSTGPPLTVPNLSGDTQAQAQAAVAAKGLTLAVNSVTVSDASQNGLVTAQSPSSGSSTTAGSTVTVSIGQYTAPTTTTSTTAPSTGSSTTTNGAG